MAAFQASNATFSSTAKDTCKPPNTVSLWPYCLLFFISGFPALLYQIVWERALFTIYGVNIESVTVIVTVFLLGLGLGSLAGGRLSAVPSIPLLRAFGLIEFSIGVFGAVSLKVFHGAAVWTAGASTFATGAITFLLLLIPTLLMGSTLPLLTAHMVERAANVGESVGTLYCANTFGSAAACFAAALVLMRLLGESGSTWLAAMMNVAVGLGALVWSGRPVRSQPPAAATATLSARETISLRNGMFLAGATGFISLAYEILWYRLYSFASGGAAPTFAKMLAFYLAGIAYGSLAVRGFCHDKREADLRRTLEAASKVILLGSIVSFLVGPLLSFSIPFIPYDLTFVFVFAGSALLGAAFPLLSHATIDPAGRAGSKISYLYLSNIIGSALGSFLIGFIVLDHWSVRPTSALLLCLGASLSVVLAIWAKPFRVLPSRVGGWVFASALVLGSGALFGGLYERLLFKSDVSKAPRFSDVVENRSGVIAVTPDGTVYGGGVYDGKFNTGLVDDRNSIFRAYAIAAFHPQPKDVLVIGLSSGSWAQVLAHHPAVESMTIVEINPGYLGLIEKHSNVASLLRNPKVHIDIDDGRRWLTAHPGRRFDLILMNTSFHWRANVSNLLSREFLNLVRSHLKPGGVEYYNTTSSQEVQATGVSEFPYALRVANFLAVSDRPLVLDRELWRRTLSDYKIDGKPVFDLSNDRERKVLEDVVSIPYLDRESMSVETESTLRPRLRLAKRITDDHMGTEWQQNPE
jgi:spermidine synthase